MANINEFYEPNFGKENSTYMCNSIPNSYMYQNIHKRNHLYPLNEHKINIDDVDMNNIDINILNLCKKKNYKKNHKLFMYITMIMIIIVCISLYMIYYNM